MKKTKYGISAFLFILAITVSFILVSTFTAQIYDDLPWLNDYSYEILDLSEYDFEHILQIDNDYFYIYPDQFYYPEDFLDQNNGDLLAASYAKALTPEGHNTVRMRLQLKPGQVYAVSSYSANYAQRLFINGIEYPPSGSPSTDAASDIASTNYFIASFIPPDGLVDIIIHQSNYVHSDGGGIFPLYLGYEWQINQAHQSAQIRTNIVAGCMITVCLLFFGLFLFFPKKHHLLWFSLSCLMITFWTLIVELKTIMILFPDMRWEISIRLEYLGLIGMLSFLPLYVHHFFGKPMGKWLAAIEALLGGGYTLMVLFTPPLTFTYYLVLYQCSGILTGLVMIGFCIHNASKEKQHRTSEHLLMLIAIILLAIIAIPDVFIHSYRGANYEIRLTQSGMLVFIFINMLAQILGFFRTEEELLRTQQAERELAAEKDLLERLNNLKNDYLDNITHEMKTPLSVMAGYAQLTHWQMEKGTIDSDTLENLKTISSEAHRLAKMAGLLLELSSEREHIGETKYIRLQDIGVQVVKLCEPLLLKKDNTLLYEADENCPMVCFHPDSMIQVLLNLISNANRHTHHGTIKLGIGRLDQVALVTVSDTGNGIHAESLPHIFERGKSMDGRTGLGLSICKELIENSGGSIFVESIPGEGTTIKITLPLCQFNEGE